MGTSRAAPGGRIAPVLETILPLFAAAVFVIVWAYVAVTALTESSLAADTWAWLSGLDTIPAVIAWLAMLPLGFFLWAWQADLEPLLMGVVMLGLLAWTWVAWAGLVRATRRRRGAASR